MPAKRFEMFYGPSGTGKSEAIARVARLIAEQLGLRARVLIGDGSYATYDYAGLIEAGIVDVVNFAARKFPLSTMDLLLKGWWPEDTEDPDSPLIPPSTTAKTTPNKLSEFGVYAWEGLTVGGFYIMGDQPGGLANRAARGEKIGQDSPIRVGDGEYKTVAGKVQFNPAFEGAGEFGANPPAHYGVAQKRLSGLVQVAKMLPMEYVITTAHERAVEDNLSKEIIIGPEVPGSALTKSLQRDFNNTLHFDNPAKRIGGQKDDHTGKQVDDIDAEFRIYTRDHYSANGNITYKYRAVTRGGVTADEMPLYLTGGPGDAIEEFYMRLKKIRAARASVNKEKFEAAKAARTAA
jgi:hypothetical protein